MSTIKKWVWQHKDYPQFSYDFPRLKSILLEVSHTTGKLEGIVYLLNDTHINAMLMDVSTDEIVNSSQIEGKILSRESVRSSVRKKLDKNFNYTNDNSTRDTDGLVEILFDSSYNNKSLTQERLHGWHNALFPTGYSNGYKIDVAKYRSSEMNVVSTRGYKEVIHYVATPHEELFKEMNELLEYINHNNENPYVKSAIAHLWFVSIHPYDDGNGRIARTITNYILSKELGLNHKYYSISLAIRKERKSYYETLEKSQNLFYNRSFDFTKWILWHTSMINNAIKLSIEEIEVVMQKTKFWDKAREYPLNERQLKVINKILYKGIEHFEGGLSTKKYANMTKISNPTAKRDINQLLKYGIIVQIKGSAGRNTRYELLIERKEQNE